MYLPTSAGDVSLEDLDDVAGDPIRWAFLVGVRLLRVGRASLLLRDEGPTLRAVASVGIEPSVAAAIKVEPGEGIAGVAAERAAALYGSTGDQTYVSVPIVTMRAVEGVLNLTTGVDGRELSDEDFAAAQSLADHIAHLLTYEIRDAKDSSSGLPTKRVFADLVERELVRAERTGNSLTLVLIRVENGPTIRTRLGVKAAREVVNRFLRSLQRSTRRYDVLARDSNDTFAMLLPQAQDLDSSLPARVMAAALDAGESVATGLSVQVGLACCPADGATLSELLANAESRMRPPPPGADGL